MKAIVFCIVGTLLVLLFANPRRIAEIFNPSNRLTVEQAQDCCRALTGMYPRGVPVLVVGNTNDMMTEKLEAELRQRGVAYTPVDVTLNPQARTVMNKIGQQEIPTTIVGTTIIPGCKPNEVEQVLLIEQKSLKWPVPKDGPAIAPTATSKHGEAQSKGAKHGHGHARAGQTHKPAH